VPGVPRCGHAAAWRGSAASHPGNHAAAGYRLDGLRTLIDELPEERRQNRVRGDSAYGHEACLLAAEKIGQAYLFKLRRSQGVVGLIRQIERERETRWQDAGQGRGGTEGTLRLQGWSLARRVVILRRRLSQSRSPRARRQTAKQAANLWTDAGLEIVGGEVIDYGYPVSVSNRTHGVETLAPMYRARGDAETPFDELKNQRGRGGFTTRRMATSQQAARLIAFVYNGWTLYNRLVTPGNHQEAITGRPRLPGGVARQGDHAGQKRPAVRLLHADAPDPKPRIIALVVW